MKITFEHEGQTVEAEAQNVRGTLWIHFQGRTFTYESETQARRSKKGSGAAAKGEILAPMPGKVTKILKAVGDSVELHEAVLVMEAMKMEYTLKAEKAGILKSISCQVGDQVSLGKKMAQVEDVMKVAAKEAAR